MRFVTLFLLFLLSAASTVVFAQGGPEAKDPTTNPLEWYASIGGVGAATIFLVGVYKKLLADVAYVSRVPTWMVAVLISAGLTVLCVYVFGTLPGSPLQLITQSVYNAAIASGVHGWLGNPTTTIKESSKKSLMDKPRARRTRRKGA